MAWVAFLISSCFLVSFAASSRAFSWFSWSNWVFRGARSFKVGLLSRVSRVWVALSNNYSFLTSLSPSSFFPSWVSITFSSSIWFLVSIYFYFCSRATEITLRSWTSLAFAYAEIVSSKTCWDSCRTFCVAVSFRAFSITLLASGSYFVSIVSTKAVLEVDCACINFSRFLWSYYC